MKNKNIIYNLTYEQYKRKYRNRSYTLVKCTKKEVEDFDKTHNTKNGFLLNTRKWALIGDTYYEIPKAPKYTWFRNLHAGIQTGICLLGIGVISTAITLPIVLNRNEKNIELPLVDPTIKDDVDIEEVEKATEYISYKVKPKNPALKTVDKINKVKIGDNLLIENVDYECKQINLNRNSTGKSMLLKIFKTALNKYEGKIMIYPSIQYVKFNITVNVTNGTYLGDSEIQASIGECDITLTPNIGFKLPDSINVTGAEYTYNKTNGLIHLKNAISDVTISCSCNAIIHQINTNIVNGSYSGDTEIQKEIGEANVTLIANDGYKLPDNITVSGATYTYNKTTGVVHLSKATGDISITCECVAIMYSVSVSVTNGTYVGVEEIQASIGECDIVITADIGYKLTDQVTINGANYTYNKSTGVVHLKNATGNVTVTCVCDIYNYQIITNITNGTYSGDTKIQKEIGEADITLSANNGYKLPDTITVSGATYTYNKTTGAVHLSQATGDVSISCECAPIMQSIAVNISNGTYSGDSEIQKSIGNANVTLTANDNYKLPDSITVTGATHTYNKNTGVVTLSNATSDVSITCECAPIMQSIAVNITNGTYSGDTEIQKSIGNANVTLTANDNYKLPDSITVTGATHTYDKNTGIVTLSNATSDVSITCECAPIMQSIAVNISNGTYSGDTEMQKGVGTASVTLTANANYHLPETITVSGSSYTYDKTTGVVSLNTATGDVTIQCDCVSNEKTATIDKSAMKTKLDNFLIDITSFTDTISESNSDINVTLKGPVGLSKDKTVKMFIEGYVDTLYCNIAIDRWGTPGSGKITFNKWSDIISGATLKLNCYIKDA